MRRVFFFLSLALVVDGLLTGYCVAQDPAERRLLALVMAGLLTRLHSLGLAITMTVAWAFHHGMKLTGPGAGELPFSWIFIYLLIVLAGPGKYSLDRRLGWTDGAGR